MGGGRLPDRGKPGQRSLMHADNHDRYVPVLRRLGSPGFFY